MLSQYGQHRMALDLEAFGREYAAQKEQAEKAEQAEKQAQERTRLAQTPKPPAPRIERSGGYGIGD